MKIGIEIEALLRAGSRETIQRTLDSLGHGSVAKYDGSLPANGVEVVTAPLALDDMPDVIRATCAALYQSGAYVNEKCGLHVHITAPDTLHGLRNLARRWINFEDTIDRMVDPARRGNACYYARSNAALFGSSCTAAVHSAIWEAAVSAQDSAALVRMFCPSGRYYKLNLHSLSRHGTVEFRNHQGSVSPDDIAGWARFVYEFATVAIEQQRLARRPSCRRESPADRVKKITRNFSSASRQYVLRALNRAYMYRAD